MHIQHVDNKVQLQVEPSFSMSSNKNIVHPNVQTFPFSVVQQLQNIVEQSKTRIAAKKKANTHLMQTLWTSLQPYSNTYISFVDTDENHSIALRNTSHQYTLLPTTQQLHYVHSLVSSVLAQQDDYVSIQLSCPDAKHLANCLHYCQHQHHRSMHQHHRPAYLQDSIRFIEPVSSELFYTTPTQKVQIRVKLVDVPTLCQQLTGQVHIDREDIIMNYASPEENNTSTHHFGQMCRLFHYHNVDDSPVIKFGNHIKYLRKTTDEQHLFPVPLRHTSQKKKEHTHIILNKDIYHPHQLHNTNTPIDTYETLQHSLPIVDRNANILHEKLAKKLTSGRILFDIEQSFDPTWFNVLENNLPYQSIPHLRQHFGLKTGQTYTHLLNAKAIINCDENACSHHLLFTKVPTYDNHCVAPYNHTQHEDNKRSTLNSFPNEVFGYSERPNVMASKLTHLLYGSLQHFHNNIDTPFQKKTRQCYRSIEGYGAQTLQLYGVVATPLFRASPIMFLHIDHFDCVFRQGQHRIELYPYAEKLRDYIQFPLTVASYCRLLSRILNTVHDKDVKTHHKDPSKSKSFISAHFCKYKNSVQLSSEHFFEIVEPAGLGMLGAHTHMKAILDKHTKTYRIRLCTVQHLTRNKDTAIHSPTPQFHVCFKYTTSNPDEIQDTDTENSLSSNNGVFSSPNAFAIRNDEIAMAPVELPSKYPLHTLVGRDGTTRYASTSLHHTILLAEYVAESQTTLLFVPSGVLSVQQGKQKPNSITFIAYRALQKHLCCTSCWKVYSQDTISFVLVEKQATLSSESKPIHFYNATPTKSTASVEWSSSSLPHWIHQFIAKRPLSSLEHALVDNTHSTPSIYHVRVKRHPQQADWIMIVSHRTSETELTQIVSSQLSMPMQPVMVHLQMTMDPKTLVCNVLDTHGGLHCYRWKQHRSNQLQQPEWELISGFTYTQIHMPKAVNLDSLSAINVCDKYVILGHNNAVVNTFTREKQNKTHYAEKWNMSEHLTHVPLIWKWTRHATAMIRSVLVECFHHEPIEHLTLHQCHASSLAPHILDSLYQWFGCRPLATLHIAYFMREHSLHSVIPFCRYLLHTITGHSTEASVPPMTISLTQHIVEKPNIIPCDADQRIVHYIRCQKDHVSLSRREHACFSESMTNANTLIDNRLERLCPSQKKKQRQSKVSNRTSRAQQNKQKAYTTSQSINDLFYFKMSKLLSSTSGVSYVRNMYAQSNVFRHQFHQCRGYCYYKLLFKLKHLAVSGNRYSRRQWSEEIRDKYTTVTSGDTYHICQRCGDTVCKQDDGLRLEFGAQGLSSTHQDITNREENAHVAEYTPITFSTQQQQHYLTNIYAYIDKKNLSTYQNFIFDLPITSTVQKYIKEDATVFYHLCTNTNVPINKILKLLELACEAVQQKIQQLQTSGQHRTSTIEFQRKPWEAQIVGEWFNTLKLQKTDIQRGIPPRKDFRPQLFVHPSTFTHDNWKQLHRELNGRTNTWNNTFDWTSQQNTNVLYEHNDLYVCVNRSVVNAEKYTTLPQLTHCELEEPVDITCTNHEILRYSFSRIASSQIHTVFHKQPVFPYEDGHTLCPHHQIANAVHTRNRSDTQRRQLSTHYLCASVQAGQKMFPYILQTLIDHRLVQDTATVDQILCLLGLTTKQKLRMSTNPSFMQNLEWVKYYQQLDASQPNESTSLVLKQIKHSIATHVLHDLMRFEYDKFIEE